MLKLFTPIRIKLLLAIFVLLALPFFIVPMAPNQSFEELAMSPEIAPTLPRSGPERRAEPSSASLGTLFAKAEAGRRGFAPTTSLDELRAAIQQARTEEEQRTLLGRIAAAGAEDVRNRGDYRKFKLVAESAPKGMAANPLLSWFEGATSPLGLDFDVREKLEVIDLLRESDPDAANAVEGWTLKELGSRMTKEAMDDPSATLGSLNLEQLRLLWKGGFRDNPEKIMLMPESISDSATRGYVQAGFVKAYLRYNSMEASDFIAQQPSGDMRDRMVLGMIDWLISAKDVEPATLWANEIGDPKIKSQAFELLTQAPEKNSR